MWQDTVEDVWQDTVEDVCQECVVKKCKSIVQIKQKEETPFNIWNVAQQISVSPDTIMNFKFPNTDHNTLLVHTENESKASELITKHTNVEKTLIDNYIKIEKRSHDSQSKDFLCNRFNYALIDFPTPSDNWCR